MSNQIETIRRAGDMVIHDDTVYLSGQVGESEDTVSLQMRECLRRIDDLLRKAGSSRDRIRSVIIWLSDMVDVDEVNELWDAWVPTGCVPARACGTAQLANPELKVEVVVTAKRVSHRSTHWRAPTPPGNRRVPALAHSRGV